MSEKKLAGQVAWVSGAASGMGAAIATRYAAAGAQVMAVDVQDEMGNEVVARIRAAGGTAVFAHCDVAQGAEVAQSIEAAVAACTSWSIVRGLSTSGPCTSTKRPIGTA